ICSLPCRDLKKLSPGCPAKSVKTFNSQRVARQKRRALPACPLGAFGKKEEHFIPEPEDNVPEPEGAASNQQEPPKLLPFLLSHQIASRAQPRRRAPGSKMLPLFEIRHKKPRRRSV
ncbi:MAG: hypothetical protein ACLQVW_02140, partial [Limisphaerales bacterium]